MNPHIHYPIVPQPGAKVASTSLNHPISKKIRLQQLKLLLHASHHYRSFTISKRINQTHTSEDILSTTQVLHGEISFEDNLALSKKNEPNREVEDQKEEENTLSSSSVLQFSIPSSSPLTKHELLTKLLQTLSIKRQCPCKCTKTNCLFLYCECYSLQNRQKGAYRNVKLQRKRSRRNACHQFCKCQKHANHDRSRRFLSTFRRIKSHPIATPAL